MSISNIFQGKGFIINGILNVSPSEAFELCKQGVLMIDVREEYLNKMKCFDVDEVVFLPLSQLISGKKELPQGRAMIFADATGLRSREAVKFLTEKGVLNIANLAGGLVDWERAGLPVRKDLSKNLYGQCPCQLRPKAR